MTNHGHLRFGVESPDALIVACRGGRPQKVQGGWFNWLIQDFREMSGLEFLARDKTAVVMPDVDLRIYRDGDVINEILQAEQPDRAYFFGFSRNASAYVETVSKRVYFDGAAVVSGIDPPTEADDTPRKIGKAIVIYGVHETCGWLGLRSCKETAEAIQQKLAATCPTVLWAHNEPGKWPLPGHTWPKNFNEAIALHLGI